MKRVEKFGIAISVNFAFLYVDRFLLVEMAKALPFFRRMEVRDQASSEWGLFHPIPITC
jgi:hypothetical protein